MTQLIIIIYSYKTISVCDKIYYTSAKYLAIYPFIYRTYITAVL